jgi:hypothetical protein
MDHVSAAFIAYSVNKVLRLTKGLPRPRTQPRAIVNNIDDAIDAIIDLGIANSHDDDEFEQ